jgi:hypothetical protein
MKELLEKVSSYNLFNYLLPGTVFVFALSKISDYNFLQKDLLIGAFLYYFIGLIISRVGSIIIEPLLKKWKFLKFAKYSDFVIYSKKDEKIDILSETNNMYRTIIALILSLVLVKGFDLVAVKTGMNDAWQSIVVLTLLLALFLFSYRKQTDYITKRIKAHKENNNTQQSV